MVQSVAFFTGFETGDGSELAAALTAASSIQSTTVRTGGYALKLDTSSPGATQKIRGSLGVTQIVVRVYIRVDATNSTSIGQFWQPADAAGTTGAVIFLSNAGAHLSAQTAGGSIVTGTKTIVVNRWYRLDVLYNSINGGIFKVYVDGVLDISTTETTGFTIDQYSVVSETNFNMFFDDLRIDTGGLNIIGAGQCIARQGIAGTPTYDAWTKNGAATAALCWSDTPFSAATNCSDGTQNDAQTMVVDKFSTNPGRAVEGTQVINGGDTINAVKVAMIAKTAVAGNIDIRRRVGGVNTDTTVALTTADLFYATGIFTDTPANLDAYEIGVKNDLVATIETVEDMWMMVDYTPAELASQIVM